ncbi:MAG: hypothetical protein GX800_02205 [Clostridiaceae bacterium]|nr:hypothetical protein [Clostridiaceae bacterium]
MRKNLFSKKLVSSTICASMAMSMCPIFNSVYALTDADVTSSIELGKGYNIFSGKSIESGSLSNYQIFKSSEGLSSNRIRVAKTEGKATYITDMSSYLNSKHTNVETSVEASTHFLIGKMNMKAKFGFSGNWSSGEKTKNEHFMMEVNSIAYQYALNMGASDPWGENEDGTYKTLNDKFVEALIGLEPELLFSRYGTHVITKYDAGGTAYAAYEGKSIESSSSEKFYIETNAEVYFQPNRLFNINTSISAAGGEDNSDASENQNKQTSMKVRGGDTMYSSFEQLLSGDADEQVQAWLSSMYETDPLTNSSKAVIISDDNLELYPIWNFLELKDSKKYSSRIAELKNYYLTHANNEYVDFYKEFIYNDYIDGGYNESNFVEVEGELDEPLDPVVEVDDDYIQISTQNDLARIGRITDYPLDGKYVLTNDISMDKYFGGIGTPEAPFTGVFDGGNYTISYLKLNPQYYLQKYAFSGLFPYNSGTIKNLNIKDCNNSCVPSAAEENATNSIEFIMTASPNIDAKVFSGVLCGYNAGIIENVSIENVVSVPKFSISSASSLYLYSSPCIGYNIGILNNISAKDCYYAQTMNLTSCTTNGNYAGIVCGKYYAKIENSPQVSNIFVTNNRIYSSQNTVSGRGAVFGYCSILNGVLDDNCTNIISYDNIVGESGAAHDDKGQLFGRSEIAAITQVGNLFCKGEAINQADTNTTVKSCADFAELFKATNSLIKLSDSWDVDGMKPYLVTNVTKPYFILLHRPGLTCYQNGIIDTNNMKLYYAKNPSDVSTYKDITTSAKYVYDFSEAGPTTVKFSYLQYDNEFRMYALEKAPKQLNILSLGKTEYKQGEEADTSLLTIELVFNNGDTEFISNENGAIKTSIDNVVFEGDVGERDVTISYQGMTGAYKVNVIHDGVCGKLVIKEANAAPGNDIKVHIYLENNPGLISLRSKLYYDKTAFTLKSVSDNKVLTGFKDPTDSGLLALTNPQVLKWLDEDYESQNNEGNGEIVTLTFGVNEKNPIIADSDYFKSYDIKFDYLESRNSDGELVSVSSALGKINLVKNVKGDVDGDTQITDWDGILLNRYLNNIPVDMLVIPADIDGNGVLEDRDVILLLRHNAGLYTFTQ